MAAAARFGMPYLSASKATVGIRVKFLSSDTSIFESSSPLSVLALTWMYGSDRSPGFKPVHVPTFFVSHFVVSPEFDFPVLFSFAWLHLPSCSLHQHTSFWLFAVLSEMIVHIVELSFFVAPADWQNAMSNNFSRLSQNLAVFTADLPRLEALDPSSIKRVNLVLIFFSGCVGILAWFQRSTSRWLNIGRTSLLEVYLPCFKNKKCLATCPQVGRWDEDSSLSGEPNIERLAYPLVLGLLIINQKSYPTTLLKHTPVESFCWFTELCTENAIHLTWYTTDLM